MKEWTRNPSAETAAHWKFSHVPPQVAKTKIYVRKCLARHKFFMPFWHHQVNRNIYAVLWKNFLKESWRRNFSLCQPLKSFSKAFNFLLNVHVLSYRQLIKSHGKAREFFKWHMSDGKVLSYFQRAFFAGKVVTLPSWDFFNCCMFMQFSSGISNLSEKLLYCGLIGLKSVVQFH